MGRDTAGNDQRLLGTAAAATIHPISSELMSIAMPSKPSDAATVKNHGDNRS
jgi:hypothetical protein